MARHASGRAVTLPCRVESSVSMHRNTLAGKRVARVMRHGAPGGVTGRPWNRIRQGTHQMAVVSSPIPCQEVREGAKKIRSGGRQLQSGYALLALTAAGSPWIAGQR